MKNIRLKSVSSSIHTKLFTKKICGFKEVSIVRAIELHSLDLLLQLICIEDERKKNTQHK